MAKNKRKIIRDMLFEVYDKGVQNEECNLDFYYEKMMQALNIPCVIKSVCDHNWKEWEDENCNAQMRCTKCKTVKQTVL